MKRRSSSPDGVQHSTSATARLRLRLNTHEADSRAASATGLLGLVFPIEFIACQAVMGNCMTVDDVTAARVHDTLTMKAQAVNGKAADANPASQGDSLWAPSRLLKRGAIKAAGGSGTFNEINVSALPKIPKDEATRKMLADAFAGSVLFSVWPAVRPNGRFTPHSSYS